MPATPGLVQLHGHTQRPRHEAIPLVTDALTHCGVLLEDLHEYSNRVITYRFEIDRDQVGVLAAKVIEAGFTLEDGDASTITESAATVTTDADGFVRATLQLTFPAEDGERRNPNPDRG